MIAMFALPLLCQTVYSTTMFLYELTFNGRIFAPFNPYNLGQSFYENATTTCVAITIVGIYSLVVRCLCGIDTQLKKMIFALGIVFYLLAHQVVLVSVCLTIAQTTKIIEWNLLNSSTCLLYISTLMMSLWIYRILVSRKNETLKIVLASLSNLIIAIPALVLTKSNYTSTMIYISIFAIILWFATIADITFEGIAYKTLKNKLNKTHTK